MPRRTKEPRPKAGRREMRHQRTAAFRAVYADGALIRRHKNELLITFYYDDVPVCSENVEVIEQNGTTVLRSLQDYRQEPVRWHEVMVRLTLEDSAALVAALLSRLEREAPHLLAERGIEATSESSE